MQSNETTRFSELELDAWRGFLRSHVTLVRELDEELTERHGLPLSSYDVLVQLDETPEGRLSQPPSRACVGKKRARLCLRVNSALRRFSSCLPL